MYSPRVEPDKVERLHKLRQELRAKGQKTNMIKLVDEALDRYLTDKERELSIQREEQKKS